MSFWSSWWFIAFSAIVVLFSILHFRCSGGLPFDPLAL